MCMCACSKDLLMMEGVPISQRGLFIDVQKPRWDCYLFETFGLWFTARSGCTSTL